MADTKEVITILNNLIETSKDGEEGFRSSAENINDGLLKSFFLRRSLEVAGSAKELQEVVRSLGGEPETTASITGSLHRRWVDIKTAITSNDNLAVLNEVERGEDVALKAYKEAVVQDLPVYVRDIVQKQLEGVQRNHDEVKALRDHARELEHH
ncbi:MAG TPA: PA2169 family four-helix-bundle protein [Methylophilaceae bacterium]|nr:PA2169 family four-helix-bundle protein [Methylophilaceae bacterium]